jgi:hypothetical protein
MAKNELNEQNLLMFPQVRFCYMKKAESVWDSVSGKL